MRGGLFRHRVTLVAPVQTEDAYGQPQEGTVELATVWAEVRDLRGREFFEARQVPGGEVTTQVRMRYRADVTRQMQVIHAGRVYEIEAVQEPTGRHRELLLLCRDLGERADGDG